MPDQQADIEQIEPEQALELYVAEAESEKAAATIRSHRSRLGHFIRYCNENSIEHLNELSPKDIYQFRIERSENINKVTLKTHLDTLRVFLRFCERLNAVPQDFSERVSSPTLDDGDNQRGTIIDREVAEEILEYLSKWEYASNRHVALLLMWRCGARIGAVHSLDVEDVDTDEGYIEVEHRPDSETPLKNKERGERHISISEETAGILNDYIRENRYEVTDETGREPLITTQQKSRAHKSTIRDWSYRLTRPCELGHECPHNRDPETCEATNHGHESKCPSSKSAHAWRRGAITHWLRNDIPVRAVSDRANVSEEVIDQHYDERSDKEKMEQRREFFVG